MSSRFRLIILCVLGILLGHASSAAVLGDTLTVYFRQGRSSFDPAYMDNEERCQDFIRTINNIQLVSGMKIDGVEFYATASPEGPVRVNERLAKARARNLSAYLQNYLDFSNTDARTYHVTEDWTTMIPWIEADPDMPSKEAALEIIRNASGDESERQLMALDGGAPWKYIYENYFPKLRCFRVDVHVDFYISEIDEIPEGELVIEDLPPFPDDSLTPVYFPLVEKIASGGGITLKTNTLGWTLIGANVAVEYDVIPHLSVALPFYYSGGLDYFKETLKFRGIVLQPEVRYYPWLQDGDNGGFYVGAHLGLGWYNFALDGDYRIQDHKGRRPAWGGGLGVGYSLQFKKNPRWGMEFALGAGVYDAKYDMFYNEANGPYFKQGIRKTWFGIDNAAVSFTYRFDLKKKGGKK